ncbi:hypothetical protein HDU96_010900 [Phlyctochytrium bullatum]|nr:hypothetical protein HDU96_010900 [Phlyctochytrium bullatum]
MRQQSNRNIIDAVKISANGASFPNEIYQKLISYFVKTYGGDQIASFVYSADSSAKGQTTQDTDYNYQWGGIDYGIEPPTTQTLMALPAVAGAIAVAFNLPLLTASKNNATIRISRSALPLIFDRTIRYWNDSRLVDENEGEARAALANTREPIQLVVRNPGSGTSKNFIKYCQQLNSSFKPDWATSKSSVARNVTDVVFAKTNQAVGLIVASIPYTITYMDREELDASRSDGFAPVAALIQNRRMQYVLPNSTSLSISLNNLNNETVRSWNPYNGSLQVLDVDGDQAYPISIVSNFIIRQNNISSNADTTAWTLRFMWWVLFSPETEQFFNGSNFLSLRQTPGAKLSLSWLRQYQFNSQPLFNRSVCDFEAEGDVKNGCQNGRCLSKLPFQPPDVKCVCNPGFSNNKFSDCREQTPVFSSEALSIVQLILAGISIGVIAGTGALIVWYAKHPKLRAISPMCCYVILVGCMCGAVSIVAYAATPADTTCRIRIFFPATGFGLVFGMLLLKTYRIYTIFGYSRLKTSRGIRDVILMYLTIAIALVEIILCALQVLFGEPRGKASNEDKQATFQGKDGVTDQFMVCDGKGGVSVAMDIIIYAYNAILLLVALLLAIKTRGAFKRFAESKAIALVTYVVTICVCMGLPVLYAIPIRDKTTNSVINMVRCVLFFILSTGTPLILFAKRLSEVIAKPGPPGRMSRQAARRRGQAQGASETDLEKTSNFKSLQRSDAAGASFESGSDVRSNETSIVEHAHLQSFMFEVGICRNRFGAAWSGARLLMLPLHDILFFVDSMHSAETITSMRISTTIVSSPNWDDPDISSMTGASQFRDGDERPGSGPGAGNIMTASGFIADESTEDSQAYQKRMVILLPEDDRSGWFVEFLNVDKLKIFRSVHNSVITQETSASEILGSIQRSLQGIEPVDSPKGPLPPNVAAAVAEATSSAGVRSPALQGSPLMRVGSTFEGVLVHGKAAVVLEEAGVAGVVMHDFKPSSTRSRQATGPANMSPMQQPLPSPVIPAAEKAGFALGGGGDEAVVPPPPVLSLYRPSSTSVFRQPATPDSDGLEEAGVSRSGSGRGKRRTATPLDGEAVPMQVVGKK